MIVVTYVTGPAMPAYGLHMIVVTYVTCYRPSQAYGLHMIVVTNVTGPVGFRGSKGFAGRTGPSGFTGRFGQSGNTGATGATGPQGTLSTVLFWCNFYSHYLLNLCFGFASLLAYSDSPTQCIAKIVES